MKLAACAFDLGNTLVNDAALREYAMRGIVQWLSDQSIISSGEEFANTYLQINHSDDTPFVSHTFGEERFFSEALRQVGANPGYAAGTVLQKYREFVLEHTEPDPDVIAGLGYLRERGLTVALISNESVARVDAYLAKTKMRDLFDHVFVSAGVGFEKPDLRIFEFALREMHISGPEMTMFGDNDIADGACKDLGITYVGVERYRSRKAKLWETGESRQPDVMIPSVSRESLATLLSRMETEEGFEAKIDR